jgi:2-oxoisovalerate dehydrogenase E1 component
MHPLVPHFTRQTSGAYFRVTKTFLIGKRQVKTLNSDLFRFDSRFELLDMFLPSERLLPVVELLSAMRASQECDRQEGLRMRQGKGWFQMSCRGHEPLAALAYVLGSEDYIFPHYRDRALMLARGMAVEQLALDFLARTGSSSEGRNLPGHFSARELNVFSIASPVASQCLPAVGAAWGFQQDGTEQVALCMIGEAATRQGEFYEAVCFAVEKRLPVLFVVEDNGYGISTPTHDKLPFRLGVFAPDLVRKVNGRKVLDVYQAGRDAVERMRNGDGPAILWCELDRMDSHAFSDDQRRYRQAEELAAIASLDPVQTLADYLMTTGELTSSQWDAMQAEIEAAVKTAYEQAESRPFPAAAELGKHLYQPSRACPAVPIQPEQSETPMVQAVNRVLEAGLRQIPGLRLFGEDIEAPKGGVFNLTAGLSEQFPDRVTNAPLAEATIIGAAVGLAATGYRPVFEIQFADFLASGFNQLASQVATLRWRSNGAWNCPMLLYAPYGGYFQGGGIWHTQSNEAWWTHIPGLRVAVPSTPEDAVGLFWSAFHDDDPTLILLPKHLLRKRQETDAYAPIPFGKAAVRRAGSDVTVVVWGNGVELAEQAAAQMETDGVSVEVLDLRSLVPCDWETIKQSIARTGRLVVVQEDSRTASFGDAIVGRILSDTDFIYQFYAAPQVVAREDGYVPFCPELAEAALPDVEQVIAAIRTTMGG